MTLLLVSVRSAEEGRIARNGGADGLVLAGEVAMPLPAEAVLLRRGGEIVPPGNAAGLRIDPSGSLPRGRTGMLAVFGDRRPAPDEFEMMARAGHPGLVLTAEARLLDRHPVADLAAVTEACRGRGLLCGFSGGLEPPDIPRLLALRPDFLVFGRALRSGEAGKGPIDPERLRLVRELMPRFAQPEPPAAGQGDAPPLPPDRIFVRDLVVVMPVGAYQSEHGRSQRVRFSVEAELLPLDHLARDMRDVVSYDLIGDAVGQVTSAGHVDFVETLAEAVAERILVHPRITRLCVRVEKLDLGPGSVGVEIWRGKPGRS